MDDAFQGKGLGTLLLERLALIAAKRGVRRFQAFVLAENKQMLSVFMESGFRVRAHREGGEVEVEFEILMEEETARRFEWREKVSTIASLHPFFFPRGWRWWGRAATRRASATASWRTSSSAASRGRSSR